MARVFEDPERIIDKSGRIDSSSSSERRIPSFEGLPPYSFREGGYYTRTPIIVQKLKSLGNRLLNAIAAEEIDEIDRLLAERAPLEHQNHGGVTPLILAAERDLLNIVEKLIKAGSNVSARDYHDNTALHFAAENNHLKVVQYLIQKTKIKVNSTNCHGASALTYAARRGHTEVVKTLLGTKKFDIKSSSNTFDNALQNAVFKGHREVVEVFIKAGANVNVADGFGMTPLMAAALNGRLNMLELLIGHGANLNAISDQGRSALILATQYGCIKSVEALIRAKADLYIKNSDGYSAIIIAALAGNMEIVQSFKNGGADINSDLSDGKNILIRKVQAHEYSNVKNLLKAGVGPNITMPDETNLFEYIRDSDYPIHIKREIFIITHSRGLNFSCLKTAYGLLAFDHKFRELDIIFNPKKTLSKITTPLMLTEVTTDLLNYEHANLGNPRDILHNVRCATFLYALENPRQLSNESCRRLVDIIRIRPIRIPPPSNFDRFTSCLIQTFGFRELSLLEKIREHPQFSNRFQIIMDHGVSVIRVNPRLLYVSPTRTRD